jgi:hypothetical protein
MKPLYLLLLVVAITSTMQAQFTVKSNYTIGIPQGKMADNINPVHQFIVGGGYQLPGPFKNINIGAELGAGNYANLVVPMEFSFGNGNPTTTNINYSSNTFTANAVLVADLLTKTTLRPYVTAKVGVQSWSSRIRIDDPEDLDGCEPLESRSILKDKTMTMSYGAGVKVDLSKVFRINERNKHFLDISVTQLQGGNIDYINTRKLSQHDPNAVLGEDAKSLNMKFINITNSITHDHQVAEVYNTPLRLLEIKIGYHMNF